MPAPPTYIQRLVKLEGEVAENRGRLNSVADTLNSTLSNFSNVSVALTGGLVGGRYQPGLRDTVEEQARNITSLMAMPTELEHQNERLERQNERLGVVEGKANTVIAVAKWGVGVLTTILVALLIEGLNQFFGWYGTAAAAHEVLHGR